MRVLGIDPGLASIGYGIIECSTKALRLLSAGTIQTSAEQKPEARLQTIFDACLSLLRQYKPQEAGIETLYFSKNVKSALPVMQARGVIMLACAQEKITIGEYSPLQIKQTLVGNGRALKNQVDLMVRLLLGIQEKHLMDDHASDALAAAVCHYHQTGIGRTIHHAS